MKNLTLAPISRFAGVAVLCTAAAGQTPHLSNVKQLTFGGQNAEAYWSPDGSKLVFQSTHGSLACDQMFIMNSADGSGVTMVSTGKGVTTCGYFLADGRHVLYASTHEAGEACPKRADRSKGYVWDVYPGFDIYVATLDGKIQKKLTGAPGYDAEATVNWKKNRIVYTSLASGDLDLWSMKPDGSDKRQLTKSLGYDGGAVYSRDGKSIVWRANHPNDPAATKKYKELLNDNLTAPMKMELFVSDANGRNVRQLTNFGCASFAPTFTPDGRQILFASNKQACDSRKFELFLINTDGTGLEQVTDFGGFTSFPEFSPDGRRLVFVSDQGAKGRYEFNIFTAQWK